MTVVSVYSRTHSVTYVADNILKSLKDIIRQSGLNPEKFVNAWGTNQLAIKTWLDTEHLVKVELEIYHPRTDALIVRWDIDISYGYGNDEGEFWTDTDQLKYAIRKAGVAPNDALYRLVVETKAGRPDVSGWGPVDGRSTQGMVRQSLGSTVQHGGLAGSAAYWRKA